MIDLHDAIIHYIIHFHFKMRFKPVNYGIKQIDHINYFF